MGRIFITVFLALFACISCKQEMKTVGVADVSPEVSLEQFLDSSYLKEFDIVNSKNVFRFYEANNFTLVWSERDTILPAADSLIHFIYNVPFQGLFPEFYHIKEITKTLSSKNSDRLASLDVLLTDSFLSLWYDLKFGRHNPEGPIDSLGAFALKKALGENSISNSLHSREPENSQYRDLKSQLAKILNSKKNKAIIVTDTIKTLFVNLERWRWESKLPDRYVFVNIPAYQMKVIEDGKPVLDSKVIVGKSETPTQRITSVIDRFTIYPYWHIPRKIAVGEMLPLIQSDMEYINRHNLDVLDRKGDLIDPATLNWKTFHQDYFPVVLRQREGVDNSLGTIKFTFKNPYAIYLHDTNARRLFKEDDRALSHGCVRVEKARDLAFYLVKEDSILCTPDDLQQYLEIRHRMEIDIVNPIPVYIRYFTAEANADTVIFYQDIYKIDEMASLN
jgi:murein L,D-transpeptidase YcbB/YkuD